MASRVVHCKRTHIPGLRLISVEFVVGSQEVQLPVALLKHVDSSYTLGSSHESLLHAGRVDIRMGDSPG